METTLLSPIKINFKTIMQIKNPAYFGKILHKKGFRVWFLYMFKLIEGRQFIEEELHADLFQFFQDTYDLKISRGTVNEPPRSAKTTLAMYFIAYALAEEPRCNFIYTSYSQELLMGISRQLSAILKNPAFQAMYRTNTTEEDFEMGAIDEFWQKYLNEQTGKDTFSSRKILTKEGGVILFASVGSAITGFGAGIRGVTFFSGCLIIDDGNKPSDISSSTMREKVKNYFSETLLSRLNDSLIAIINIQQRLHIEDLSGFLQKVYNFFTLKKPLIVDGICQLPSQYTEKRLIELQTNEYVWAAQYQQEPILKGGNLFKGDAIRELARANMPEYYNYRFVTADLSYKDKEENDYTVFSYWGVKKERLVERDRNHLYLIDVKRKRIKSIEVEKWIELWIKEKISYGFRYIWIEDKSHGIYLNQKYRNDGLPVPSEEMLKETLPRERDKPERANNVIPCLDLIAPNLTFCNEIEDYPELLQEILAFPKVTHDDFTDTVIDAIKIGLFTNDLVDEWDQLLGTNG